MKFPKPFFRTAKTLFSNEKIPPVAKRAAEKRRAVQHKKFGIREMEKMRTMRKMKKWTALLLSVSMLFLLFGCAGGGDEAKAQRDGVIKFAVIGPMTGDGAAMGRQQQIGAEIAMQEINDAGGILDGMTFEMEVFDDQGLPNQALIISQKIGADSDIKFAIGHVNSGCSLAALPTYEEAKLPLVSGTNTAPSMCDQGYNYYARICVNDSEIMSLDTAFALEEFDLKKPAVMYENTDYGVGGREVTMETLKKYNVEPVADVSYIPTSDRDFSAQITAMKAAGADCVIFIGEYSAASIFLKQRTSMGFTGMFIGGASCANPKIIEIAGAENAEGIYTITPFNPQSKTNKLSVEFAEKFHEKTGEVAGEWGSHAYDCFMTYVKALEYSGGYTNGDDLIRAIKDMPAFDGCTGKISVEENGECGPKELIFMTVENGEYVEYVPQKYDGVNE